MLHLISALAFATLGCIEPGVAVPLKRRQAQGNRASGIADDELELLTASELDELLPVLADEATSDPALSAHGFQRVAALRDNGQMGAFMRRLIKERGYNIMGGESFKKLIPHFNGRQGNGTYAELLDALAQASRLEAVASNGTHPNLAEGAKSDQVTAANIGLEVKEQPPKGWAAKQGAPEGDAIKIYASAPPVALSVHGFQRAAALQDNGEMGTFVRRVIEERGYKIKDEEAFKKIIPQFNGRQGNGTYVELLTALGQASWLEATSSNSPLAKLSDGVKGDPAKGANSGLKVKLIQPKGWAAKHSDREDDEIVSINEREVKGDQAKAANTGSNVKELQPKGWAAKHSDREGDEIVSINEREVDGFVRSDATKVAPYVVGQIVESRSLAGKWWKGKIAGINGDGTYSVVVDDGYATKWPDQGLPNIRPVQSL